MLNNDTLIVDADSPLVPSCRTCSRIGPPPRTGTGCPRVEVVDGQQTWVMDGHAARAGRRAGACHRPRRAKEASTSRSTSGSIEDVHAGAYDPKVRLEVLDEFGIDAQVIFPSTIGLGGQDLGMVDDDALCALAIEIYNDRMAEIQADSGNRLLPHAADAGVERRHVRRRGEAGRRARLRGAST